jgi:hypothetical protein
MLDFNTLSDFSRTHCISICAFLVPANLFFTIQAMIFTALYRPKIQLWQAAGIGNVCALIMVIHVLTWFQVGVVMAPTYILLLLASTCLFINNWAIAHPQSMSQLLRGLYFRFNAVLQK